MKKYFWLLLILLTTCKRDAEIKIKLFKGDPYVKAGVVSKNMVYRDFIPDIVLDSLHNDSNENSNACTVDINQDKTGDLVFENYSRLSDFLYFSNVKPLNSENNKVSINASYLEFTKDCSGCFSYTCSGILQKSLMNDTINARTGLWTPAQLQYDQNNTLSNGNYDLIESWRNIGNWHNITNGYFGIRFVQGADTLYGWVRMSVNGYTHVTIHDCAYQQK